MEASYLRLLQNYAFVCAKQKRNEEVDNETSIQPPSTKNYDHRRDRPLCDPDSYPDCQLHVDHQEFYP